MRLKTPSTSACQSGPEGAGIELTRRQALRLLAAASAGAVLAACGSAQPGPSAAAPSGQPKTGGTLRVGRVGDLPTLEPHQVNGALTSTVYLMYDRLAEYDDKMVPQPRLAESWDISPDGRQYTFHLRKGVHFHTGREMTSNDVKYNIARAANPKTGNGQFALKAQWFTDVQTPDKYTAVLKMDESQNGVFDLLVEMNIVDRETMEGPDAKTKIVGTGPFTFVEWVQGDHFTVARNKDYWRPGLPYLDGVTIKILRDPQNQIAQFEAGALDIADAPLTRDVARLQKDPKYSMVFDPPGVVYGLELNTTAAPLDNQKVRQALNYAVDRKRAADTVWLGLGEPVNLPWPQSSPAYDAAKNSRYTFDLDKAKALLTEAGIGDVTLDYVFQTADPDMKTFGEIYQGDLAKIGVKLNISGFESAAYLDELNNKKFKGMAAYRTENLYFKPAHILLQNGGWKFNGNYTGYQSEQYTQLTRAISVEQDPTKLKQLTGQLNDLLLDLSAMIPIAAVRFGQLSQSNVHGNYRTAGTPLILTETWLS